eukprot:2874901-Pyramimonas_sp.AAC.1
MQPWGVKARGIMALPPAPLMTVATPVVVSAIIIMAIRPRGRDQVAQVDRALNRVTVPMTCPDHLG